MDKLLKEIQKLKTKKVSISFISRSSLSKVGFTHLISDNKLTTIIFHTESDEKMEFVTDLEDVNDFVVIDKLKASILSNVFNIDANKIYNCIKSDVTIEQEKSEDNICIDKEQFKLYIQRAFIDGKIIGLELKDTDANQYYHDKFEDFDLSKIEELVTQAHAGDIEVLSGVYNGREMTEEEINSLSQEFIYQYHYDAKF